MCVCVCVCVSFFVCFVVVVFVFVLPFKENVSATHIYQTKQTNKPTCRPIKESQFKSVQQRTEKANTTSSVKQNIYYLLREMRCKIKTVSHSNSVPKKVVLSLTNQCFILCLFTAR